MGDIKNLLKEARKLIDDKNYTDAQECCKNILRKDKQNYFGLVLLGKALQDSEQAPLAYQKAIASKPEHPLAWQGLASFYERNSVDSEKTKLFAIYNEMLKLQLEEEKALEIISKLGQLGSDLKSSECLSILMKYLEECSNPKLYKVAAKYLICILKTEVAYNDQDITIILKHVHNINLEDPDDSLEILRCKLIFQKSDFSKAVEEIIQLNCFVTNVSIREWLCEQLCVKYASTMTFSGFNVEQHIDTICEGIVNSKYPNLLRSMICYDKGFYLEAYKQCIPIINYHEANITEATFIIRCTIMLKKWSITQKLATNFLSKVKDQQFAIILKKFLFVSLNKQQKWREAIDIVKNIPNELMDTSELAGLAECYIEMDEPFDHIMKHLQGTNYYKQLGALLLLKNEKYEEVINLLEGSGDNSICLFYLGKAYWEMKEYNMSLINLLKAAKVNPDHIETFWYLGHYYHDYKGDYTKAKKCYEKAYELNTNNCFIAKRLSEIYTKLQLLNEDFELLNTLRKNVTTLEPWVFFRLGLHYLKKREWENAIQNFRNVIKTNVNGESDNNRTIAFECLADAYYSRGSFTSALKAYNKVIMLDPHKTAHCLTRIGYIYSLLTQYDEAITTFKAVFKIDPYSFLALKGVVETWMRIAKKRVDAKLYGAARDGAQHAIDFIIKALTKQKAYMSFWKLLADALMFIAKLPNKYAFVYMPELNKEISNNSEIIKKEKLEILQQAIVCYSYITKQRQQLTSYDLASAYLSLYYETKKIDNCHIAFKLTINCIKEKPMLWRHWNLLGKICIVLKKYEIAQHCFIKALSLTRKFVAKIWCNLGALYLKLKLYKQANYCFWRGQSMLPSYPQSWIGQGLIAEEIQEEEAMDLFRHACRLGYHPESALAYADCVCRVLKNNIYKENSQSKYEIEGLYAVSYAIDLIEWFCNFQSQNPCAYNILGILQEKQGLICSAVQSYQKALKLVENDKKNMVLLNLARTMLRLEQYDEAINTYKAITEASFDSTAGLALALFKKGLYEESYSVYDTALQWLSDDNSDKADLLVGMAGIVYLFKGADEAKTLLFHSIQISQKKPTPHSLFAICSLGLIHSDESLSKLALSELRKYEKDYKYGFDIGFLKSYLYVCEGDMEEAITVLSDSLHEHPCNTLIWFCMTQYCLKESGKAKIASTCALNALSTTRYSEFDCNAAKMLATASIAEHLAGDYDKSFLLAKGGLHMYSNESEIWAALLLALVSNNKWADKKKWLLGAVAHMRRQLNISRPISRWIILMEKKLNKQ